MIQYSTEIDVGGIILRDPLTALTNIGIFLAGFIAYQRLRKSDLTYPNRNWIYFFLLVGISSLLGVIVHGFSYYTSTETHYKVWWAMGVVQGAGITLAQFGWASNVLKRLRAVVPIFCVLQFGIFAALLYIHGTFNIAKIHIGLGLVPIMIHYIYKGMRGLKAEILVATGIGVSSLTAIIHTLKLSLGKWCTYNDLSHILIVFSLFLMFRGVQSGLHDDSATSPA